ncbi:hypothetical protein EON83_03555 [bacterium]|nr:MAG: hypothetical protein EON83_03555 [bacterium]
MKFVTIPPAQGAASNPIAPLKHRVGDKLKERYDVLEALGGGNFGTVYRVLDTAVGNILAAKEMHVLSNPDTPSDERQDALELFRREALNLATIRHPNIPAAYFDQEVGQWHICPICGLDWGEASFCPEHGAPLLFIDARYYLMMDFVDGLTLEEVAATEMQARGMPLDENRALGWISQIASAVRTLHRVGTIHRDIKPDNIKIRTSDEAAVLLDFGLTKKVGEAGGYGTVAISGTTRFGTLGYAPDNPQERDHPEKRSDIYALGMTLYRLLSGRDPQNEPDLREMRLHSPRYFNTNVSPETEILIQRATQSDLDARFQSIDEFLEDLNSIIAPTTGTSSVPAFTFADGTKARTASELARLFDSHSEEAKTYLFNGMLGSWLVQNGFAAPARVAMGLVRSHSEQPDRALELLRRALYPTGTTNVLPRLEIEPDVLNFGSLDSGAKTRLDVRLKNTGPGLIWGKIKIPPKVRPGQTALSYAVKDILSGGAGTNESEPSLPGLVTPGEWAGNDVEISLELDTARVPVGAYSGVLLLETDAGTTRVPVSYSVVPLELEAAPPEIDFGSILVGRRAEQAIAIRPTRASGGIPRGAIYVGPSLGILSAPERFEGQDAVILSVDASSPSAVARLYEGLLQIDTNGGRLRVPVRYRISLPIERLAALIVLSLIYGALTGAGIRFFYGLVNPTFTTEWLLQNNGRSLAGLDFRGLGPLMVGSVFGAYGCYIFAQRERKVPPRERFGPLKNSDDSVLQTLPMLGLALGAFAGYLATELLHWTLWSAGDWLLFPIARLLPGRMGILARENAPFMWALLGGFTGFVWGVGRALSATGRAAGRIVFGVFTAVLFLFLLLFATLSNN